MKLRKKGFTVSDLTPIAVFMVAIAIAISLGSQILGDLREDQCADDTGWFNVTSNTCQVSSTNATALTGTGFAYNATSNGLLGTDELSGWLPTIALVAIVAILLGIIITYLARRFM